MLIRVCECSSRIETPSKIITLFELTCFVCIIQRGEFTAVTEPDNLRSKMASYYNYFGRTGERPVVAFSAPYYDAFGLGTFKFKSVYFSKIHTIMIQKRHV